MPSELKSDRWVGISEVGLWGEGASGTWPGDGASANQRKPHKGFEASKGGLGNRAGKVTGLYCQIILDAIKRKDWREE